MQKNIRNLVLCMLVLSLTSGVSFTQEPDNAITIKAMPKATKGFPFVIKVIIKGPQKVKYLSINENGIPITVYLKSKFDENEYIIKSRRTFFYTATTSDGRQIELSDDEVDPPVEIPDGKKYTMMFDLWSLSAIRGSETTLSDIPSGKYSLFVELNSAYPLPKDVEEIKEEQNQGIRGFGGGISTKQYIKKITKSNSIDVELIEPSDKEKQFIEVIHSKFRIGGVKGGVSWVEVLRRDIVIPNDEIPNFKQITKDQLSFHKLISDVNIVDEKSRNQSIEDVNGASLPEFFEPERQLLLLELKGNHAAERQNILKNYSDLEWYVEKLESSNAIFLVYKEILLQMKKNKEQSAVRRGPNIPSMMNNNDPIIQERNSLFLNQGRGSLQVDPNAVR